MHPKCCKAEEDKTMNVKLNDNVLVIAGKDKGKQGKVIATSPKAHTVTVEGVRIQKKHEKAKKANESRLWKFPALSTFPT